MRLAYITAAEKGLQVGVSFHVGSQQRNVDAWDTALSSVAGVFTHLADHGITPAVVNLGGGFPGHYIDGMNDCGVTGCPSIGNADQGRCRSDRQAHHFRTRHRTGGRRKIQCQRIDQPKRTTGLRR